MLFKEWAAWNLMFSDLRRCLKGQSGLIQRAYITCQCLTELKATKIKKEKTTD